MENITVSIRRVGLLGIRPNTAMPIATNKTANNNYTYPRISLDTTIHIYIYVQTKNVKALVLINKLHTFQRYLNISIWHVRILQYGFETCQLCPDDEQCPTSPTYRFIQNRTSKVYNTIQHDIFQSLFRNVEIPKCFSYSPGTLVHILLCLLSNQSSSSLRNYSTA